MEYSTGPLSRMAYVTTCFENFGVYLECLPAFGRGFAGVPNRLLNVKALKITVCYDGAVVACKGRGSVKFVRHPRKVFSPPMVFGGAL